MLNSMLLVKLLSLETLTAFMFIISIPKDPNGMKYAANKLKIITQLQLLLGKATDLRLESVLFVGQLTFLMFVLKNRSTRASLNSLTCLFLK